MYETRYHGPFDHTIRKLLHIQQWTRQDISYAVTRLASFTKSPNKKVTKNHCFLQQNQTHDSIDFHNFPCRKNYFSDKN